MLEWLYQVFLMVGLALIVGTTVSMTYISECVQFRTLAIVFIIAGYAITFSVLCIVAFPWLLEIPEKFK